MKKEYILGIKFVTPPPEEINNGARTSIANLISDWKGHLRKVVKGPSDEGYFVITGLAPDAKGLTARFLNPYFEQTGRPREIVLPGKLVVELVEKNAVTLLYENNLKKIRSEIDKPQKSTLFWIR
jgi:hypothetical protein